MSPLRRALFSMISVRVAACALASGALSIGSLVVGPIDSPDVAVSAAVATAPAAFTAITPCRLIDTRSGGERARVDAGGTATVRATGNCGVPEAASVVAVTITAVDPLGGGYLSAYPSGSRRPDASVLNYGGGDVVANQQFVALGGGSLSVFSLAPTHLVVDVAGYFEPAVGGLARAGRFVPVPQRRLIDTRETGRLRSGSAIRIDPGLGVDASAVVVNVTATETVGPGFVSAYPAGERRPGASMLNIDRPEQTRAASAVVKLGPDGFDVHTSARNHLIVDIVGYFTAGSARSSGDGLFVGLTPVRLADTRNALGSQGGPRLWDRGTREFDVRSVVGASASAVALNVTVTATEDPGFALAYPAGAAVPSTSSVNYDKARHTIANAAIVGVSTRGVALRVSEATQVVVDVAGWFTGVPTAARLPTPPNTPPERTVTIISDSAMAGIRWNGALAGLQGFRPVTKLESCRRLVAPSCNGREGYSPRSVVGEIQALPIANPEEILVIATGYNDWHARFGDDFDAVIVAARIRGFHHIAWVDYRSQVGYRLPGSGGVSSNYGEMNRVLGEKIASGAYPDVWRWRLDDYTRGAPDWFYADGVHERRLGSWGVADWISRHVRAFDGRACVQPWSVGGPIENPCPNPDDVVGARRVPNIAALYPGSG